MRISINNVKIGSIRPSVSEYYKERTHGVYRKWSQQIETFLGRKTRLDMLDELKKQDLFKDKKNLRQKYMSQARVGDIFNTNVARSFIINMS